MRTNIEIDDRLMRDAMRASGGKTKRAVVDVALRCWCRRKHLSLAVRQGIPSDQQAARVLRDLRQFEIFDTGGADLAIAAARNDRHLRARGMVVRKTIDCLIASFCLVGDHALLHSGGH